MPPAIHTAVCSFVLLQLLSCLLRPKARFFRQLAATRLLIVHPVVLFHASALRMSAARVVRTAAIAFPICSAHARSLQTKRFVNVFESVVLHIDDIVLKPLILLYSAMC